MSAALYLADPYRAEAPARVVAHTAEGGVILDDCLFYPTGGGQPGDCGRLDWAGNRLTVATAVRCDAGIALVPAAPQPLPPVGTQVVQHLDWERRHRHMRMHTALHLLSVVIPLPVSGGQVGETRSRLDFDMPEAPEDKEALEAELNAGREPPYDEIEHPFNLNIGKIEGGNWASSVPSRATLEGRIGFAPEVRVEDIMEKVRRCVEAACADLGYLVAATARPRGMEKPVTNAGGAVDLLKAQARPTGVLFGNEAQGLSNDHVALCDAIMTYPVNKAFASLNLSQAIVQRYLYPSIWEALAVPLLVRPFWEAVVLSFIVLLVIGSGIVFLTRQRRRTRSSERS